MFKASCNPQPSISLFFIWNTTERVVAFYAKQPHSSYSIAGLATAWDFVKYIAHNRLSDYYTQIIMGLELFRFQFSDKSVLSVPYLFKLCSHTYTCTSAPPFHLNK